MRVTSARRFSSAVPRMAAFGAESRHLLNQAFVEGRGEIAARDGSQIP
jgi:hypothetical protein